MTASQELPSHEEHIDCGGTAVLDHEVWRCRKCRRAPLSVFETKTVYHVNPDDPMPKRRRRAGLMPRAPALSARREDLGSGREPPAAPLAVPVILPAPSSPARSPAPAPVEVHHLAHVTYQLRFIRCGKARCDRWHGPYWYAFYRDSAPIGSAGARKAGKTRCTYIGRTLPAELAAALGRPEVDSAAEDTDP